MRPAIAAATTLLTLLFALEVAPAEAQDAGAPDAGSPDAGVTPTAPRVDVPSGSAAPAAEDAAPPARRESREVRESREDRERWRVPSDLVNPFTDDPGDEQGYDQQGDDQEGYDAARRARASDASSWFIAQEDLVDPWRAGRLGPFYGVRCAGRWCRPDRGRELYLAPRAPVARPRRGRRPPRQQIELAALVSASTVGDSARARLEVQATVHRRSFGLGLSLSTSAGDARVDGVEVTHPRHAIAVVLEHRFTDGSVAIDVGAAAGVMLMDLEEAQVAPLARVMATAGISLARGVDVLVRADALTTFMRPGEPSRDGPSAFEFGMGLGLRIATP